MNRYYITFNNLTIEELSLIREVARRELVGIDYDLGEDDE